MTTKQMLEAAIAVANADARRTAGVRHRLTRALGQDGTGVRSWRAGLMLKVESTGRLTKAEASTLVKVTREILSRAVARRHRVSPPLPASLKLGILPYRRTVVPWVHGDAVSVWTTLLVWVLSQSSVAAIRQCPGCERFFVRVRRQVHCSSRCRNRLYMRRYRRTPHGQSLTREAAHQIYRRLVNRAKAGTPLLVARRPRV